MGWLGSRRRLGVGGVRWARVEGVGKGGGLRGDGRSDGRSKRRRKGVDRGETLGQTEGRQRKGSGVGREERETRGI